MIEKLKKELEQNGVEFTTYRDFVYLDSITIHVKFGVMQIWNDDISIIGADEYEFNEGRMILKRDERLIGTIKIK